VLVGARLFDGGGNGVDVGGEGTGGLGNCGLDGAVGFCVVDR